jgi:hypothetical protein
LKLTALCSCEPDVWKLLESLKVPEQPFTTTLNV